MRQLAAEKEQHMKEKEMVELRCQLLTSRTAPAQKKVDRVYSRPEVRVVVTALIYLWQKGRLGNVSNMLNILFTYFM